MRQKDANIIAKIIGNEMRLAVPSEIWGLETAAGAVKEYMVRNYENFNTHEFDRNLETGKIKGLI